MRTFSKKTIAVVGSGAVVVAAAGAAYAYYLTSIVGTGTGTATPAANASQALTFSSSAISGLVPGAPAVSTTVTFSNPNNYAVSFPARTVSVASVSGPAGCATNAVALLSGTANLAAGVLPANGSTTVSVPVAMADSIAVDQTACAGSELTVTYSAIAP